MAQTDSASLRVLVEDSSSAAVVAVGSFDWGKLLGEGDSSGGRAREPLFAELLPSSDGGGDWDS